MNRTHVSAAQQAGLNERDAAFARIQQRRASQLRKAQREAVRLVLFGLTISSDDLHPLHNGPEHRQYLGAALNGLAKAGVIHSVGRVTTRIKTSHGRKVELWALKDRARATAWLSDHPPIETPPPTQREFPFRTEA